MFAADFRAIGLTIAAILFAGFIASFLWNVLRSRKELGSEIELAANRKEFLPDEELEGWRLDRSLSFALVLLTLMAVCLPFYWIAEPGRQEGAVRVFNESFERRGLNNYVEVAQCANCHAAGGAGGVAAYVLQDADGQFVANANWMAPALDTVLLRYSEDEVRYVLNFGRPGSPMAAWGTPGGGPLTSQQIDNIIIYLRTVQKQSLDNNDIAAAGSFETDDVESLEAQAEADDVAADVWAEVERSIEAEEFETVGEAVFNLGLYSGYGAGAYSCARCHTSGWSLGLEVMPNLKEEGVAGCGGGDPSGIGYNLCNGSVHNRFPDDTWHLPDGSWYRIERLDGSTTAPIQGNPAGYDGTYVLDMEENRIPISDTGQPLTESGEPYIILGENPGPDGEDVYGDLAECGFVSKLWQPEVGPAYPVDPTRPILDDGEGHFVMVAEQGDLEALNAKLADGQDPIEVGDLVDPIKINTDQVGEGAMTLDDGSIVAQCTIVDMPTRTSQAMYEFIYNGADAGVGYGRGGLSAGGQMPGFGKMLPPELIQAVVDYERGL
jgi:mono/diheme cytochrome c family protein